MRNLGVAVVLALATAASTGARGAETSRCSLGDKYFVRSVAPYQTQEDAGYTVYKQFRGAELFVPAQPGMTQEWLQRVLSFQVAAGECDFGVRSPRVSVLSSGGGFSVRVSADDERFAAEILRRAEQLVK